MADPTLPDEHSRKSANRMWTPWRMDYVARGSREQGCVFCNRFHGSDDRAALILHRGVHCFVIMNLFPYAVGHTMIVPNEHVAGPEQASPEALREMAEILPAALTAARSALSCAGFNVGMNIGGVAGAGVADHMHEHIVPRWPGDANFMPVLASTVILPELPPVTYAKLRAEFERDIHRTVKLLILDETAQNLLVMNAVGNPTLPTALVEESTPVWRSAVDAADRIGVRGKVIDWAGDQMAGTATPGALLMQAAANQAITDAAAWVLLDSVSGLGFDDADAAIAAWLASPALLKETP